MTKEEFKDWLQGKFDAVEAVDEFGDVWRDIDSGAIELPDGVSTTMAHPDHDIIFACNDGWLASGYEFGMEGETIWFFADGDVGCNIRDYSADDLQSAVSRARDAFFSLQSMLPAAMRP